MMNRESIRIEINDIVLALLESTYTLSLSPIRDYLKVKRERNHWKNKDIYGTRADNS